MAIKLLTVDDVSTIISTVGIERCFVELVEALRQDFSQWATFDKMSRIPTHLPDGVIELMPVCGADYYAYKYVNGHPNNPAQQKLTVAAVGMLSDVNNGYPVVISEMTLLTALRTAATCALASQYLARQDAKTALIIGTGSQSEFQVLALKATTALETVYYFDKDRQAMTKFADNLSGFDLKLTPIEDVASKIGLVDIIITATAAKSATRVIESEWVRPGVHINSIGGDCPGKTELDPALLERAKVVVEYLPQSKVEGEIQNLSSAVYAELWELVTEAKPGRETPEEITLFDSVGFALEDYTVLKYFYGLSKEMAIGHSVNLIPELEDPKNLFSRLVKD